MHAKPLVAINPQWAKGKTDQEIKDAHKHLENSHDLEASIQKHREKYPAEEKVKKEKQ